MIDYYELVRDDTIEFEGETLTRIRGTINTIHCRAGGLGGYIGEDVLLFDGGWVDRSSKAAGRASVSNFALLGHGAVATDYARISGGKVYGKNSRVCGHSRVYDGGVLFDAIARGHARVTGRLEDGAIAGGTANVWGTAQGGVVTDCSVPEGSFVKRGLLTCDRHAMIVGPVGSEGRFATLNRTASNPYVSIGCWDGPLSSMMGEVRRRSADVWPESYGENERGVLLAEYEAVHAMFLARVASWGDD